MLHYTIKQSMAHATLRDTIRRFRLPTERATEQNVPETLDTIKNVLLLN